MSNSPEHAATDPGLLSTEPAAISEAIRYVAGILVAAGWLTISDGTLNTIITIIGALVSLGLTFWTRAKVTPVAKPVDPEGAPLVAAAGTSTPFPPTQPPQSPPTPPTN